ncbi:ABC transporter ATP-binding protein [Patescibacteria group bacterium]|nr:ABC transporter ATP-binding protein [Patescibacteria group bacterium]MBU4098950.1 ABC transporter ATP-binding protein [Patescibacteria group bacterium]
MEKNIILEVKNLTKKFNSFTAVDDLSLEIGEGEVLGLLGPNGAGKTTTIHILLGVMEATGGIIKYFDKPFPKERESVLKQINYSSTYISMPWLSSVDEILNIYARLYEVDDKKKRIAKLLGEFEIEHLRKQQFSFLSAGEKTRLFLVKAFLNYPKLILLDEPTASLDPDIAIKIRRFLKKEKAEYNVSMLFTSHNMSEVEEMCDRVMIIKSGKIIDQDTPENLAKKLHNSQVELLIMKDNKIAENYFKEKKFSYTVDRYRFVISLAEQHVAEFLQTLTSQNIKYEEISINKPTLEDYFLEVLKEKYD